HDGHLAHALWCQRRITHQPVANRQRPAADQPAGSLRPAFMAVRSPGTGPRLILLPYSLKMAGFTEPDIYLRGIAMARVCQVTGKRPATGNNVSHANNKTRRRFL